MAPIRAKAKNWQTKWCVIKAATPAACSAWLLMMAVDLNHAARSTQRLENVWLETFGNAAFQAA